MVFIWLKSNRVLAELTNSIMLRAYMADQCAFTQNAFGISSGSRF